MSEQAMRVFTAAFKNYGDTTVFAEFPRTEAVG